MTNFPPSDEPGSEAIPHGDDSLDHNDEDTLQPEDAADLSVPGEGQDLDAAGYEPATDELSGGVDQLAASTWGEDFAAGMPADSEEPSVAGGLVADDHLGQTTADELSEVPELFDGDVAAGQLDDAIDTNLSDDELLAAASASVHDEPDMVNPTPGASGADPNHGADFGAPDPGPGVLPPRPHGPPLGYPASPSVRRIYRSRHDRRLGGVSAGIAEYFRIDPTLVRLATLLAAFTGVGILVYIAAWIIIPLRPEGFVEAPRMTPVANERTMTLAFGIGALALAFGIATGSWAVLAIALIGGGVWLLSEHTAVAPGLAGAAPASGVSKYQAPGGYEPSYVATTPQAPYLPPATGFVPPAPPVSAPFPVKERTPQRVTWIVLSLLALLTAVGVAAASGDWWNVSATRFLGIGVVIIGVGVVVGQLRNGGARGLIPLGILAALALFPVSAVDGLLDDGVGEANYRPTNIAELESKYEHGVGQMTVDLSELDFDGLNESIDIDLGIGELIVIVSDETGGQAVLQAKAGEVSHMLPNTNSVLFEEGVNVETGTVVLEGENGTLDLNINVGLGTAELRSEAN